MQVGVSAVLHYYVPPYGHAFACCQRASQVGVSAVPHYYLPPYGHAFACCQRASQVGVSAALHYIHPTVRGRLWASILYLRPYGDVQPEGIFPAAIILLVGLAEDRDDVFLGVLAAVAVWRFFISGIVIQMGVF